MERIFQPGFSVVRLLIVAGEIFGFRRPETFYQVTSKVSTSGTTSRIKSLKILVLRAFPRKVA